MWLPYLPEAHLFFYIIYFVVCLLNKLRRKNVIYFWWTISDTFRALRTLYRIKWKTQWSQFFTLMCQSAYHHKVENWRMRVGLKKSIARGKLGEQSQSMRIGVHKNHQHQHHRHHHHYDGSVHPDMQISPEATCSPSPVPPSTNMIHSNKG